MKYKKDFVRCIRCNEFLLMTSCPNCSVKAKVDDAKKKIKEME